MVSVGEKSVWLQIMPSSFSIIIPHRDCPDLLRRCLNSIPKRADTQIIVVDDNSNPKIVDFDHFPGTDRNDVTVVLTKEGKGAGYARNVGLEQAAGKWLLFLDSDDLLLPSITEVFDEVINASEDIVFYRPKFVFSEDLNRTSTRGGSIYNHYIDEYFETGNEMELRTRWHSPWSKIIKRSLVVEKNIRFEETRYSNDVLFSALVGCEADTIAVRDNCFYVVTEREGSLTSSFCQKEGELAIRASVFFRSQRIIQSHGYPIDESLAYRYMQRLLVTDRNLFKEYFSTLMELTGYSRRNLIRRLFETNSRISKIKRKVYAYYITLI